MKPFLFLLLAVLIPASFAGPLLTAQTPIDCPAAFAALTASPTWLEDLGNPVLTSIEQVQARRALYTPVRACLDQLPPELAEKKEDIDTLTELFMIFTEGDLQAGQGLVLVDMQTTADTAVTILRDEAGIPPAAGYVFMRYYAHPDQMPDLLYNIFNNTDIKGVTIRARYIAILDPDYISEAAQRLHENNLPKTTSHELVHAYIGTSAGPANYPNHPKWYAEGLAIYFSGSSQSISVVEFNENGRETFYSLAPRDYAQYRDNFAYLEETYGRPRLLELVRKSLQENDPAVLLRPLNLADEAALAQAADRSGNQARLVRIGYFVGAAALVTVLLWLLFSSTTHLAASAYRAGLKAVYRLPDVDKLERQGNIPGLTAALKFNARPLAAESKSVRLRAVEVLGRLGHPQGLAALGQLLQDTELGEAALIALAENGSTESIQMLADYASKAGELELHQLVVELYKHEHSRFNLMMTAVYTQCGLEGRQHLVRATARLQLTEPLDMLARALDDPDPQLQLFAVESLSYARGAWAFKLLAKAARSQAAVPYRHPVRWSYIRNYRPDLLHIRAEALYQLAQTQQRQAIPILLQYLDNDPALDVRIAAFSGLLTLNTYAFLPAEAAARLEPARERIMLELNGPPPPAAAG